MPMPAAIKQYSMAVAPDSSARNLESSCRIQKLPLMITAGLLRARPEVRNLDRIGFGRVDKNAQRSVKQRVAFSGQI